MKNRKEIEFHKKIFGRDLTPQQQLLSLNDFIEKHDEGRGIFDKSNQITALKELLGL